VSEGWRYPAPHDWVDCVLDALDEDVRYGDLSASALPTTQQARWYIEAQASGVVCGAGIAAFLLDPLEAGEEDGEITVHRSDGDRVQPGDRILDGLAPSAFVLERERTALNYLMLLSGVATLTAKFVVAVEGTSAKIVDTRKTAPLMRSLQKYAVRCGGGFNHRMGLFDGVMLKDNHIRLAGSIADAVARVRATAPHMAKIEVECEALDQVREAVTAGAEIVMLDNMDPFAMREAVRLFGDRCVLEASGGITLDTVAGVAQTGVHLISVGVLTHSAPALSFHLEIEGTD